MVKGSYKEVEGDLIKMAKSRQFDVIAHGANCKCVMSAGIAAQIKKYFPEAYYADKYNSRIGYQKLGCLSECYYHEHKLTIFNLYSQFKLGAEFDLLFFTSALTKMKMNLEYRLSIFDTGILKIGLPMIGCGIGGGNWLEVKAVIQDVLKDFDVTVVIYSPEEGV